MASSSRSRYVPNDFAHNLRVACGLVPCLVIGGAVGGTSVIIALAVGAAACFFMDQMQYREGSFTACWATLLVANVAFVLSLLATSSAPLWSQISLMISMLAASLMAGMWASLQFKYIHMQHPAVSLVFERLVVTATFPLAATLGTLGLAALVDASDLAFYQAVLLCSLYLTLGLPLPSSFHASPAAAPGLGGQTPHPTSSSRGGKPGHKLQSLLAAGGCVQSRWDGAVMAGLTVMLPPALYAGVHWAVLTRHAAHGYSLLLLACGPALLLAVSPMGLWWLPGSSRAVRLMRNMVLVLSLAGCLVGFEGRVLFYAFSQFIVLSPPWDWLAVTLALAGLAAVGLAHFTGLLSSSMDVTLAGSFLLVCTTAGALAVGVPFQWLPAPLVGACGLVLFFDSASLREYILFVGGAFLTGVWFVYHHFWFLDIRLGGPGSWHLHTLCKLALAALLPALMLPGLVHAGAHIAAVELMVVAQSCLMLALEEQLFAPSHMDSSSQSLYPGWLLLATSVLGMLAVRRLAQLRGLGRTAQWLSECMYLGKAAMLLLPEAQLAQPAVLLTLTSLAPLYLTAPPPGSHAAARRRVRLPPWQGLGYAVAALMALLLARFAVFDVVQELSGGRPTAGLLLGALLLAGAACLAPLVMHCYPGNTGVQRAWATLGCSGLLLALLQPPLPTAGGARCPRLPLGLCPRLWDERHIPLPDLEDVEVWGLGLGRKDHWPRWLLLAAVAVGVGAGGLSSSPLTRPAPPASRSPAPGPSAPSALTRLALALLAGGLLGAFLALEVLPGQPVLQLLLGGGCMVLVAFLALLHLPGARGPVKLPALALGWVALAGATLLLQAQLPAPTLSEEQRRLFPDARFQVEQEGGQATHATLLAVFAAQAGLMALALKLRLMAAVRGQDAHLATNGASQDLGLGPRPLPQRSAHSADLFCGVVPLHMFQRTTQLLGLQASSCDILVKRLSVEGVAWGPTATNLAAATSFALGLSLNGQLTGGAPGAVFMLAPVLLLLHQDPLLLPGLTEARRYAPPMAGIMGWLAATSGLGLLLTASGQAAALRTELGASHPFLPTHQPLLPGSSPWTLACFEGALLLVTVPAMWQVMQSLWALKAVKGGMLLVWAALCLLPLAASSMPSTQCLALTSMVGAAVQLVASRYRQQRSARVV